MTSSTSLMIKNFKVLKRFWSLNKMTSLLSDSRHSVNLPSRRSSARIHYLWLKVILTSNKISSRGKYLKSNRQRFFIELSHRTSNERKSCGRKQILKQQKLVASHKSFRARRTLRARQISQINRQINNNRPQSRINFLARHQPSRDIFSKTSFAHWKAFGPLETLNGIYGIFIFSYSLPPNTMKM